MPESRPRLVVRQLRKSDLRAVQEIQRKSFPMIEPWTRDQFDSQIAIFPEGTRVGLGESRKYGVSGALLSCETGAPIVPIAHNSGYFWRRRGLLKKPGKIRVVIGPPIYPAGLTPRELNDRAQQWIEAKIAEIAATPGGQPRGR